MEFHTLLHTLLPTSYSIAKRIAASDQFDLDWNSNLFVIYARRATESSALSAIETHAGSGARYNPGIQVNPATDVSVTACTIILLCLGAHARSGAYGTLFVCLFVCLSVCSSHIRSAGGIQAKVDASKCIIPSFLGLGFADLQNRTFFSSYDNICSPGRAPEGADDSFERKFADACLSLNFWFLFVH